MLKKQLNRELVASFRTLKTFFFQFGTNADSSPHAKCSTDACYFCLYRAKAWCAREPFAKDLFKVQRELFELRVDNVSTVSCYTSRALRTKESAITDENTNKNIFQIKSLLILYSLFKFNVITMYDYRYNTVYAVCLRSI
jgi:hypothetical protein